MPHLPTLSLESELDARMTDVLPPTSVPDRLDTEAHLTLAQYRGMLVKTPCVHDLVSWGAAAGHEDAAHVGGRKRRRAA